jgi:hypothetical protein
MHLSELLDQDALNEAVRQKYISVQKHPDADLYVYNYAPRAQYDRYWTPETMQCRGLIVNGSGEIVARPFPKFFNLGEDVDAVTINAEQEFDVYEKYDGSLGILYPHPDGKPALATRGSFTSTQAVRGTKMLRELFPFATYDPLVTLLYEIIYPENRIVVDYGEDEKLVLLAAIDVRTGKDLPLPDGDPRYLAERHSAITSLEQLPDRPNREGYVIRFSDGTRIKVKHGEYVRLHRLITGVNKRHIWEIMRDGKSLDDLLDKVPDEFYKWVKTTAGDLHKRFTDIDLMCQDAYGDRPDSDDRKELAAYFNTQKHPAILFKMLDGKPYADLIWKLIKPAADVPYKVEV